MARLFWVCTQALSSQETQAIASFLSDSVAEFAGLASSVALKVCTCDGADACVPSFLIGCYLEPNRTGD